MKRLLLFVLFLATFQVSNAQDMRVGGDLPIAVDVFSPQRIKPGTTYQQSFPVWANQPASLKIQMRNRLSIDRLLKICAPLLAVTAYGLLKQHKQGSATLPEVSHVRTGLAPYLAKGALLSGASFALTSKRNKAYVELTYRNRSGNPLKVEGHWIPMRKLATINMHSLVDGWVDVTISASQKQGMQIQRMNVVSADTILTGNPGDGPTTSGFGIEGGSGSASDPFLLSSIAVYPDYGDAPTGYGGGFYYASGASADGYTYPPGYYQDQSVYTPPPSGGSGSPSPNDYKWKREPVSCSAYEGLHSASVAAGKEMGAVVTTDGQLITLPSQNNLINHTDLNQNFKDSEGHTIVAIYQENGSWKIDLNDFSTTPGTQTTYQLAAMIHTHPSGTNPANGQQWDTYNPSGDDRAVAGNYPGLNQFVKTPDSIFKFDSNGGPYNESAPSCEN